MDIKKWVLDWFKNQTGLSENELLDNISENYFEKEFIDSFEFIELLSDIDKLGIELENDEFENKEFSTIQGLIDILEMRYKK